MTWRISGGSSEVASFSFYSEISEDHDDKSKLVDSVGAEITEEGVENPTFIPDDDENIIQVQPQAGE